MQPYSSRIYSCTNSSLHPIAVFWMVTPNTIIPFALTFARETELAVFESGVTQPVPKRIQRAACCYSHNPNTSSTSPKVSVMEYRYSPDMPRKVIGSLPPGLTSPNSTSAMAPAPSSPGSQVSRMAEALSASSGMGQRVTVDQHLPPPVSTAKIASASSF